MKPRNIRLWPVRARVAIHSANPLELQVDGGMLTDHLVEIDVNALRHDLRGDEDGALPGMDEHYPGVGASTRL